MPIPAASHRAKPAKSEAVLPAYLVGLVIAGVLVRDKVLVNRIRSIAFALLIGVWVGAA